MRIGEFTQKHNITQDTIRYYLDIGLLVTEKKGGQYKFSEADSKDIEKIIELKQLDFSLTEIQKILTFQRISGTNTNAFRNLYLPFLEAKKNEVINELIKYNKMNDFLSCKIDEIKAQELSRNQKLGFPITSLGILLCPICSTSLRLGAGTIEGNMIIDANIHCECGYKSIIENGIYVDETAVRTKLLNGMKMPTKEEYLAKCSYIHANFLYKGMAALIEYINKYEKEPKYIMEFDNCVGFFLLQYIKYLPQDSTYILIDYDKNRIMQLKENLEMYYEHKNFIFLCCDFDKLPIAKSSIDIMVDFGMSKTYAENTGKFLPNVVLPLLKKKGFYTAAFNYIDQNSNGNLKLPDNIKDYFNKEKMLKKLTATNLIEVNVTDIGPISTDGEYDINIKDMLTYKATYIGNKQTPSGLSQS